MKNIVTTSHGVYFDSGKTTYKITPLMGGGFMVDIAKDGILSSNDKSDRMKAKLKKV